MRDKLIELLKSGADGAFLLEFESKIIADHLIANGVTLQQWIPVSERLPEEAECNAFEDENNEYPMFLAMICGARYPTTLYYNWRKNEWFEIHYDYTTLAYSVSHWMPIPEPPKEGE